VRGSGGGRANGEKRAGVQRLRPVRAASSASPKIKRSIEDREAQMPEAEAVWNCCLIQLYPAGARSGSAAGFNRLVYCGHDRRRRAGVGGLKTAQDFIGRVLQPRVWLVQLAGCLARQLTKLVAIGDMRKCSKKDRNASRVPPSKKSLPGRNSTCAGGAAGKPAQRGPPQNYHSRLLDARSMRRVQNHDALSHNVKQASCSIWDTDFRLGDHPPCIPVPANSNHRIIKG